MTEPDPTAVAAASNAWNWVPDEAEVVDTGDYLLVRYPDHYSDNTQVLRTHSDRDPAGLVDEVREHVRRWRRAQVEWWWTLDSTPNGLEQALAEAGARPATQIHVLARGLGDGTPDLGVTADLEVRRVSDVTTRRDADEVDIAVWGGQRPPDETLEARVARVREDEQSGRGVIVVAYLDGRPVGVSGLTLTDEGVARLWGAGVLEDARGRGAYRAMLDARLRWARDHGARMALVKGRVETSGPILARAGFRSFGEERSWLLDC